MRARCPHCGREPLIYPDRETDSWGVFCPTPWCRMLRAYGHTYEDALAMWGRIVVGMTIDPLEVME